MIGDNYEFRNISNIIDIALYIGIYSFSHT